MENIKHTFRAAIALALMTTAGIANAQTESAPTSPDCVPSFLQLDKSYYFKFTSGSAEMRMKVKEMPEGSCWIKVKEKLPEQIDISNFSERKKKAYWINLNAVEAIKPRSAVEAKPASNP